MINLRTLSDNEVVMTLSERVATDFPVYRFLFYNKESKMEVFFNSIDVSPSPSVFNKFIITLVGDNVDPLMGKISLVSGQYSYKVWETDIIGDFEVDPCDNLLEEGIVNVRGNNISRPVINTIVPERPVYRG